MKLILASQSPYRQALLSKLGIPFVTAKPDLDEESLKQKLPKNLLPEQVAEILSFEKGNSLYPEHGHKNTIISGDQLVAFENQILGKPHDFKRAFEQLLLMNGKQHQLITAITLFIDSQVVKYNHVTRLKMKNLNQNEIKNYLLIDQPYDCAGSYKIESSGLILFESIDCDDFTAIQGIPMIWLSNKLKEFGYEFFKNQT